MAYSQWIGFQKYARPYLPGYGDTCRLKNLGFHVGRAEG